MKRGKRKAGPDLPEDPFERAIRCPDVPYQPGDGDRKARELRRLRGLGGALPDEEEPDVVEQMAESMRGGGQR